MSLFSRALAQTRIRLEHPDWHEAKVARELLRLAFLPEPLPPRLHEPFRGFLEITSALDLAGIASHLKKWIAELGLEAAVERC